MVTQSLFGLLFPHPNKRIYPHGILRHPAQLYLAIANVIIFVILIRYGPSPDRSSRRVWVYLALYSLARLAVQPFRAQDTSPIFLGLQSSYLFFGAVLILSLGLFLRPSTPQPSP